MPPTLDMFDRKPELDRLDGEECPESFLQGERFAFIELLRDEGALQNIEVTLDWSAALPGRSAHGAPARQGSARGRYPL